LLDSSSSSRVYEEYSADEADGLVKYYNRSVEVVLVMTMMMTMTTTIMMMMVMIMMPTTTTTMMMICDLQFNLMR